MTLNHLNINFRSYSVKRSRSGVTNDSFSSSILGKTQSDLNDLQSTRKLPSLGIKWVTVKAYRTPTRSKRLRNNLAGQNSGKSFSLANDNGDGVSNGSNSEANIDKMVQNFLMMQRKARGELSLDIKARSGSLGPPFCNPQESDISLRSEDKDQFETGPTPPKVEADNFAAQFKQATSGTFARPSRFSYRSVSTAHTHNQASDGEINGQKRGTSPRRKESDTQKPQKHVMKVMGRLSSMDLSLQDEDIVQFQSLHPQTISPRKLFKKDIGGESKVPLFSIRDLRVKNTKEAYPNRKILALPLNLPLTEQMETTLKRIDTASRKSKKSTQLGDYETSLLQNTFKEYFHKINPMGRVQKEESELLNKLTTTFRSRRGLKVNSNSEAKEKSKDQDRSYKLMKNLKEAQLDDQKSQEILKQYREERPSEVRKQFLEQSYYGVTKKKEKESSNEKMKKYDAWYVSPKQRSKRFSAMIEHSKFSSSILTTIEERNSVAYD